MPRLILLNGPPASGKSTLARRYVDDHPLSLNLDVDAIRGLIGRWRDDRQSSGVLARELAVAAASVHLGAGHDVIVPQLVARLPFIERLEHVAAERRAAFHEVVLVDSRDNILRRFAERSRAAAEPVHELARELAERGEGVPAMYDRLMALVATRPAAALVRVEEGEVDRTYRAVLRHLR